MISERAVLANYAPASRQTQRPERGAHRRHRDATGTSATRQSDWRSNRWNRGPAAEGVTALLVATGGAAHVARPHPPKAMPS